MFKVYSMFCIVCLLKDATFFPLFLKQEKLLLTLHLALITLTYHISSFVGVMLGHKPQMLEAMFFSHSLVPMPPPF